MTLINKALKRTSQEERRNERLGMTSMATPSQPPPGQAAEAGRRGRQTHWRAAALLGVLVVAATVVLIYVAAPSGEESPSQAHGQQPASPERGPAPPAAKPPPHRQSPAPIAVTPPAYQPAGPPAVQPTPAPAPKAEPPLPSPKAPPLDPSQFKLGGIVKGDSNAHALINDHMLTIGDKVNGATLVVIEKYHVVLERDGQRLVLRI